MLPGLFWLLAALELAAGIVPMCCRRGPSPFLGTALPAWRPRGQTLDTSHRWIFVGFFFSFDYTISAL